MEGAGNRTNIRTRVIEVPFRVFLAIVGVCDSRGRGFPENLKYFSHFRFSGIAEYSAHCFPWCILHAVPYQQRVLSFETIFCHEDKEKHTPSSLSHCFGSSADQHYELLCFPPL